MRYSSELLNCGTQQEKPEKSGNCGQIYSEGGNVPSLDEWLREAKANSDAGNVGMYLTHCGVVRETARARVREGDVGAQSVKGMYFSYDAERLQDAIEETRRMDGIYYVRAWLNEGHLKVGDDIMRVLIGGDIRPHVMDALQFLVGRIKTKCVKEREDFG
ncbi:MAG: molybdenum cofactor biosynthesis protein MoaE [Lachnospiraceae bacterium]|nr:molybdenum cofactor biosynthesis protein MoaE [Lachnospiraceae bacterium]